jgi:hypothetical protein
LGLVIATLISQELEAGSFSVRWQLGLPSGMYLLAPCRGTASNETNDLDRVITPHVIHLSRQNPAARRVLRFLVKSAHSQTSKSLPGGKEEIP